MLLLPNNSGLIFPLGTICIVGYHDNQQAQEGLSDFQSHRPSEEIYQCPKEWDLAHSGMGFLGGSLREAGSGSSQKMHSARTPTLSTTAALKC